MLYFNFMTVKLYIINNVFKESPEILNTAFPDERKTY